MSYHVIESGLGAENDAKVFALEDFNVTEA